MARLGSVSATVLVLLALLLTGCAGGSGDNGSSGTASETPSASNSCDTVSPNSEGEASCQAAGIPGETLGSDRCGTAGASASANGEISGTFGPYCEGAVADTYDTSLIPDGAEAIVTVSETNADTTMQLTAQGFTAESGFSGRVHEKPCGADAAAAGAEVQNPQAGPGSSGEGLVLDFTTDGSGNATVSASVPWALPEDGDGDSLLIHKADDDGAAVGCFNLG